ncbi:MAG: U32 family peptidase [Peptostreptococcaceae bacterium]|nr:U32 family peptidase [Peptostreptococcaceae bacterium]
MSLPELLSPAGNKEALVAAVSAGADAVYLGGSKFSARAYAGNFSQDELREYVDYCNLRDVKVYIAVNTLIKDSEIEEFISYIGELYEMGVSALILQDIGMTAKIAEYFPDLELHASTQMTTNTVWDALFLREIGMSRVVVSRELDLSEIETIKRESGLEVEAFVHGALCLSYSGKCYFSSMNGGRSGNRGACAQPCREEYESKRTDMGKYFLSPKDMNTLASIERLIASGIDSLKIEGRMKRKEYVYLVTRNYRRAMEKGDDTELKCLSSELYKVFNRSFTGGYLLGEQGQAVINTQFQKPRGTKAAKVLGWDRKKKRLKIELYDELHKGDGLSLGEKVGRILKGEKICESAAAGEIVEIDRPKPEERGRILYKTYDQALMNRIEKEMEREKKLPIDVFVRLRKGEYPLIRFRLVSEGESGDSAETEIAHRMEAASNLSLTEEKVREQISKVGDYPFRIREMRIEMDEGIHLPLKILNQLRREGLERLIEKKVSRFRRSRAMLPVYGGEKRTAAEERKELRFSVRLQNRQQLEAVCRIGDSRIDRIYTDSLTLCAQIRERGLQAVFCLPSVMKQSDMNLIEKQIEEAEIFMSSSMGAVWKYPEKCLIVDYQLNLYNSLSHNFYHRRGIETTMSIESLYSESDRHCFIEKPSMVELPVYLYPRLMTTEYCPHKDRDGNCMKTSCQLPQTFIRNRKGESFRFRREVGCKSVIYPMTPRKLSSGQIRERIREGYRRFRLEFLQEEEKEIVRALREVTEIE